MPESRTDWLKDTDERRYVPRSRTEYALSEAEFHEFRKLIGETTGINIDESKRLLVYRRMSKRLQALQLSGFREYLDLLATGDAGEREHFYNAVTTNKTAFFREDHHFEFLASTMLPDLIRKRGAQQRKLRFWSAGCSSGEEPYSIAMTLSEHVPDLANWNAKILGTDLDSSMIATARRGIYAEADINQVPPARLQRFFKRRRGAGEALIKVDDSLKSLTTFNQLNLISDWPMKGPFDAIFCRNVFIYFDKATQQRLIERFADILADDGYLVLGHSESLREPQRFKLVGKTVYRKVR